MPSENNELLKFALSILFFPTFFQQQLLELSWGAGDPEWMFILKRIFILLPSAALIMACWLTILCLLSVVIRQRRIEFMISLLVTWWDLGKAIFAFWGGIFKFLMFLFIAVTGLARMMVNWTWMIILDIFLAPLRVVKNLGENILAPGVPWIAVGLTVFWCLLEAVMFTYVTSSLVVETLSNMIGNELTDGTVRLPLFLFMLFIVMGSYAVLSIFADALKQKKYGTLIKIGVIESVAMFVEVVFLYREFVDALVPWFAQHSGGDFQLGVFGILAISSLTWLGIRSMSWFLFASAGTPLLMAVIQGVGFKSPVAQPGHGKENTMVLKLGSIDQIQKEFEWAQQKGDEIIGALVLPPLQIIAATINFFILLLTTQHLFEIPLHNFKLVLGTRPSLKAPGKFSQNEKSAS